MPQQVLVLQSNTKREHGRKAQLNNISAGKSVADLIRSTLGPRSMLKMILDPMGGTQITNDGNAILREIDVVHPAAKHMVELARAQDEECGDGTTSVIILAGEMLDAAQPFLEHQQTHPVKVVKGYMQALDDAVNFMESVATQVDIKNDDEVCKVVTSCLGTKFVGRYGQLATRLAVDAVKCVQRIDPVSGRYEVDFKRYAKVEKIPGGHINESRVLNGVMFNKDITHQKMRRLIKNPRVMLLDCPLEYKKAESMLNVEIINDTDWEKLMEMEEKWIQDVCESIIRVKPDVVITEKGISDLAQHYFVKAGITAIRRLRKTDNNRVARATGATIVHRPDEVKESDIGTGAGLFQVQKIGDEYFSFLVDCKEAKACSIILRGASKDTLNEIERNLQDAMNVGRNILVEPKVVYGGGSIEMAVSQHLMEKSKSIHGIQQKSYQAVAHALEVIPRTLIQNCGGAAIKLLTELRSKHTDKKNLTWGVDGIEGAIVDVKEIGVMEPLSVKLQTLKTSIEAACVLIRIDDIVSGVSVGDDDKPKKAQQQDADDEGMD
ncbi:T-complex protein 1 subunit gamma [Diplonema papillatum]|nr:T-complex protein 1 subunit gamma [Diplonema papillatum]|eukprot:gene14215-21796_t